MYDYIQNNNYFMFHENLDNYVWTAPPKKKTTNNNNNPCLIDLLNVLLLLKTSFHS